MSRQAKTTRTAAEVLAIVRAYANEHETGRFDSRSLRLDVIRIIHRGAHAWDAPLEQQIMRAADKLDALGELIKVGSNRTGPDGRRVWRYPVYWTPAAYKAAELDYAARELARRQNRHRWQNIRDDLLALGFPALGAEAPELSQAQWEDLIAMAKAGGRGRPYLLYQTRNGQHLWEGPFTTERRVNVAAVMNHHILEAGSYVVAWEPTPKAILGDSPLPLSDAGVEAEAQADAAGEDQS